MQFIAMYTMLNVREKIYYILVWYKLSLYTSEIRSWYKYVLSRVSTNTGPSVGVGVALVCGVSMLMMDGDSVETS